MLKTPTLLGLAGLIVAGAVANGFATQRWAILAPDSALTQRLHALEVKFDDWQADEVPTEMPTNERSVATSRRYKSASSNRLAVITMISGIPGSVSTHTPDVCYPGSGYKTLRSPKRETIELPGGRTAVYYVADFEKRTQTKQDRVRVRWAWSTDGDWVAPDNPRWQFAANLARVPVLYKVYVVTPLAEDAEEAPQDDDATTKAFVSSALIQYAAAFGR